MIRLAIFLALSVGAFGQLPHTTSTGTLTINGTATGSSTIEPKCNDFCVEELTSKEVADLAEAQKRLDEAQKALDATSDKIRESHGGYMAHGPFQNSPCSPYLSVELRGKYALIEYNDASCVSW